MERFLRDRTLEALRIQHIGADEWVRKVKDTPENKTALGKVRDRLKIMGKIIRRMEEAIPGGDIQNRTGVFPGDAAPPRGLDRPETWLKNLGKSSWKDGEADD